MWEFENVRMGGMSKYGNAEMKLIDGWIVILVIFTLPH